MARLPAGFRSGPPLAAPAIHTGMLRSGTKSSPIIGAGRERCLDAPGLDFALSRRKQGFESPWARQEKQAHTQGPQRRTCCQTALGPPSTTALSTGSVATAPRTSESVRIVWGEIIDNTDD